MNAKQQRFVDEYLIDLNAAAAYRRAGYTAADDHVAAVNASRLMANADIRCAIDAAIAARSTRTELTQDWVVTQLRAEATDRGDRSSHSARVSALQLLGKHLGMFRDGLDVNVRGPAFKVYAGFSPDDV